MEIAKYDGSDDLVSRITRCDKLFAHHRIPNKFPTELASCYLDGDAQVWFDILRQKYGSLSWLEFKGFMKKQFGAYVYDDFFGDLTRLRQSGYVKEYIILYRRLLVRAGEMSESEKVSSYVCGFA